MHTCVHKCTNACTHACTIIRVLAVCTYTNIHAGTSIHTYTQVQVYKHTRRYKYTNIHAGTSIHTYMQVQVYIHTCRYKYTYIHAGTSIRAEPHRCEVLKQCAAGVQISVHCCALSQCRDHMSAAAICLLQPYIYHQNSGLSALALEEGGQCCLDCR